MTNRNYTRMPLTTNQHIFHLIMSVVTFGLWLPVWLILSAIGRREYHDRHPGMAPPPFYPPDGSPPSGYGVPPVPGSWADRARRDQERQPRR